MYSILLTSLCLAEGKLEWEMKAKINDKQFALAWDWLWTSKLSYLLQFFLPSILVFLKRVDIVPWLSQAKLNEHYVELTLIITMLLFDKYWDNCMNNYYYDRCLTTWSHRRSLSNKFCCSLTSYCSACSAAWGWWAWGSLFWWKKHNYTDNYEKPNQGWILARRLPRLFCSNFPSSCHASTLVLFF